MSIPTYNCLEQTSKMKVKADPNGKNVQLYQGCIKHTGDTGNTANETYLTFNFAHISKLFQ